MVFYIGFTLLLLTPGHELNILVTVMIYGACAFPLYVLFLELGVEITFPDVSEVPIQYMRLDYGGSAFTLNLHVQISEFCVSVHIRRIG